MYCSLYSTAKARKPCSGWSTEAQGLTFGLWDGAGDGGAGGSDCAHGWTHTVRWVGASHRCRVRHPGCRVDWPDGLTCIEKESQSVAIRNYPLIKSTSGEGQGLSAAHSIPSICRDSPGSEHGESGPAQIRWGATGRERREGGSAGEVQRERSPYGSRRGFSFLWRPEQVTPLPQ